jgi:hypothetical protein
MTADLSEVWPFNDPDFEGSAIEVLVSEFLQNRDVVVSGRSGYDLPGGLAEHVIDELGSAPEDELTLCAADALDSAKSVLLAEQNAHVLPHRVASTACIFGLDFALWRLEHSGQLNLAADGARWRSASRRGQESASKVKVWWHEEGRLIALRGRREDPARSLSDLADEVHAALKPRAKDRRLPTAASMVKTIRGWVRGQDLSG